MATAKKTTAKKTTARKSTPTRAATTKTTARKPAATKTDDAVKVNLGSVQLSTVDVKGIATDTAYATVGAGDRAIAVARELPQKLETVRKERVNRTTSVVHNNRLRVESLIKETPAKAQSFVKEVPTKLQTEVADNVETARKELDTYAARGRKVVKSITEAPSTKRALSQTENARSQVKGAVTSIRKAVEQGQEAVEGAVGRIGKRRSA